MKKLYQPITSYIIDYTIKGERFFAKPVDAINIESAKNEIGKKHGFKDGRKVNIECVSVIGYC